MTEFLARKKQEEMLFRLNEVYSGGATSAEKRVVHQIKSKVSRVVEHE